MFSSYFYKKKSVNILCGMFIYLNILNLENKKKFKKNLLEYSIIFCVF